MKATIIHHQGYGDLFTNNAICVYFAKQYDELIVLALDEGRRIVLENMYKHIFNIKCVVPSFTEYGNACVICMSPGNNGGSCPRDPSLRCQYIDYSTYKEYHNIKIGCFKGDYNHWDNFLSHNQKNGISFSHSFYLYEGLDIDIRINEFSVYRNFELEKEFYDKIENKDYIVIHEDKRRGLNIDYSRINTSNIYDLNGVSDMMLDQITILENAKEIHFIDSSYSVLIYFLSFHNEKIRNIPKYLHKYAMHGRDMGIYENKKPDNWIDLI